MNARDRYALRRGAEGRERLRVLARAMRPGTSALLDRLNLRDGSTCLDVGCGGGDVTVELARRVGPTGGAVGIDIDATSIELARGESSEAAVGNAEFRVLDIRTDALDVRFDLVYARFLLSHLSDPAGVVAALISHVRPGGILAIEDIDFSGAFTWPESDAYRTYHDLYIAVVRRRGGDPYIGRRLPLLLGAGGLEDVEMNVVQPMGTEGDAKLLNPMTMEAIAEVVVRDGLAEREDVDAVVAELYRFAADPGTVAGLPRVVQAWGRRAAS